MTSQDSHGWHTDEAALRAYVDRTTLPVPGASIEAHLMACAGCRERFGVLMDEAPLEQVWESIRMRIESPRRTLLERLLRRLGVSDESARLLTAVPALRDAWLLGLLSVLVFSGVAALMSETFGLAVFLLVAPLAPVAGVAACFGGDADPSHELVTVTPYSALRLLLLRTAGVLVTAVPVAVLVGLALPGPEWVAVAWLTPAAVGVMVSLSLAPTLGSTAAAATFSVTWSVAVVSASRAHEPLTVVEPAMQIILVAFGLAAIVSLVVRSHSFDLLGRQS